MTVVQNMACPACSQMLGSDHADGCPRDAANDFSASYIVGWHAARALFGGLAQETQDRTRKEERAHFALLLRTLAEELEKAS